MIFKALGIRFYLITAFSAVFFILEGSFVQLHAEPTINNIENQYAINYSPRGIGGGGAMSGFSISPYSPLWFVGTDMGTLFRSPDEGENWYPVNHFQTTFHYRLDDSAYVGFNPDPQVVFYARGGKAPQRSADGGVTWKLINMDLGEKEIIKYWMSFTDNQLNVLCATTKGMFFSGDKGLTWERSQGLSGLSRGTFIDYLAEKIYHADEKQIYLSTDNGGHFQLFYQPENEIAAFAGGQDSQGQTLAYIDRDGSNACNWIKKYNPPKKEIENTHKNCGYVWINKGTGFKKTGQYAGTHIKMAENDSQTIYVTGAREWDRSYGTKVWRSKDAGETWDLVFNQLDWDKKPYRPWPADRLEYSAVGLDVGWWDAGYRSFSINRRNSSVIGGTGNFFLHASKDSGEHWLSPFTKFADSGLRKKGKKWRSTGLEMTSILRLKFHPSNPFLCYASAADIGGLISEDGGHTFKIVKIKYNTNYDYAFDLKNDQVVFAVSGAAHDFPYGSYGSVMPSGHSKGYQYPYVQGGVFFSEDRGRKWTRLTPQKGEFNRQFLSIACRAKDRNQYTLYAGSQGDGIAKSSDSGKNWQWFNNGIPNPTQTNKQGFSINQMIIPQIELDPVNGDVYALLSGNSPKITNSEVTGIYCLDADGINNWKLLRDRVHRSKEIEGRQTLWNKPVAFAVDWNDPNRNTFWLVDMEIGNWLASGVWKTTDRGMNWHRMIQYTHPMSVVIDPNNSDRVYVSGKMTLNGTWGNGGPLYTTDGGKTWKKNNSIPLQGNSHNVTIDPNKKDHIFYTFFGGGMLYGPQPK